MLKTNIFALFIVAILFFSSCSDTNIERQINFYHWKTNFNLNEKSKKYLEELNSNTLYIRFFDVKWVEEEKKAFPFATVQYGMYDTSYQIIPTVYITNEAISKTEGYQIPKLSSEIAKKIKRLCSNRFYQHAGKKLIKEVQIDCDWSENTKSKYFELLNELKKSDELKEIGVITFSATIRLHQVKYPDKTGIPPVEKGMLMLYNMGDLQNIDAENSILDLEITKKYINHLDDYDLKCDIALPLYSWGVVFRDNKVVKLINNIKSSDLVQHDKFELVKGTTFKAKESIYINKAFLYEGDILRIEEVHIDKLKSLMQIISANANKKNFTVTFYHLDDKIIDSYSTNDLTSIFSE